MLITQTAGRAGRHGARGEVVVQTYNPEHYAVRCAMRQDYLSFYEKEIELRRELFYPPFSRLVKLLFHAVCREEAQTLAERFVAAFRNNFSAEKGRSVIGPSPALIEKERNEYRYVVLIKTDALEPVRDFLRKQDVHLNHQITVDVDPITIF